MSRARPASSTILPVPSCCSIKGASRHRFRSLSLSWTRVRARLCRTYAMPPVSVARAFRSITLLFEVVATELPSGISLHATRALDTPGVALYFWGSSWSA
jgi:hypothetical protein